MSKYSKKAERQSGILDSVREPAWPRFPHQSKMGIGPDDFLGSKSSRCLVSITAILFP